MPASNFTLKITLDEATDIRNALQARLDYLIKLVTWENSEVSQMSQEEKEEAGRIDALLRRDFR